MTEQQKLAMDLNNWIPMRKIPSVLPQFSYNQIKTLFWKRESNGLSRCSKMVGRTLYINLPMFGLYLAGEL
ncbi:hypothetical protein [Psychromonas sp. KJ10-2]|uniref:hypothetical protein n=1 Tax=Psychromonas sp. KJ10-2 TaxID=3391822 RepID=UPI0039B4616C